VRVANEPTGANILGSFFFLYQNIGDCLAQSPAFYWPESLKRLIRISNLMRDLREELVNLLLQKEQPMYLAQIAAELDERPQLIQYHLNHLVDEGLLVSYLEDRKRFYALQPVQYLYPPSSLYEMIEPLLCEMAKNLQCDQTYEEPSHILANNLLLLLNRLTEDINSLFVDENGTASKSKT
jgi:DNA-binding transcriptional ArsR family regulator